MGRRPLNTTKSGKYMNPTDQARKLARKKELKKNKKQRQMIRLAVLKSKDPKQILYEMEALDEMEFNTEKIPIFREAVLQDKRRKLREMLDRVLTLYDKEEPEFCQDIKKLKKEYDDRRLEKLTYYESVKNAKNVNVDSIPLPENAGNLFTHDPNDTANMYYSFNNHNMMMAAAAASSGFYHHHTPLLYNIPLPVATPSYMMEAVGMANNTVGQMAFPTLAPPGVGETEIGKSDQSGQQLKGILKSGPLAGGMRGGSHAPPGPPMDPPPPLSPIRTEERDEAERTLTRELNNRNRDHRSTDSEPDAGRDRVGRTRNRSPLLRSSRRSRRLSASSRSPKRSRDDNDRERKGKRERSRRSSRSRSASSSSSSSSAASRGSGVGRAKDSADTEDEEYEEIIAEDKSYDDHQQPHGSGENKPRKIRFDGPSDDLSEEKDSRSKYKQMAQDILKAKKQSRHSGDQRFASNQGKGADGGGDDGNNYLDGSPYDPSLLRNQSLAFDSPYGEDDNYQQQHQDINFAMMQNSMMMKGFPMMPPMQNVYRPAINEPLLGPPPPPLFMQSHQGGGGMSAPPPPPSLTGGGSGFTLDDITLPSPSSALPQIVGLPKLAHDRPSQGMALNQGLHHQHGGYLLNQNAPSGATLGNIFHPNHHMAGSAVNKGTYAVIEAKPQIRSLTEESIKFMPTSLRVKRDTKTKKSLGSKPTSSSFAKQGDAYSGYRIQSSNMTAAMMNSQTKDDAYATFMKEMEEIM